MEFKDLFTPLDVAGVSLKNRIITSPMYVGYGNADGTVSERMISHYERRAKGGAAMVITEYVCVHESGAEAQNQVQIWKDDAIAGLKRLSEAVHRHGAFSSLQLVHGGRHSKLKDRMAPSAVPFEPAPGAKVIPREMTGEEIGTVIKAFGDAAGRALESGFDGVEIHGGTGYLHTQFISPRLNKRTDEYGGDEQRRMRFALDTVGAVRDTVGSDMIVGYHFMADELMPGGFTLEDAKKFAPRLEAAGVSYLIVVGGTYESWRLPEIQSRVQHSPYQENLAEEIKKVVGIPVFANGRIDHPRIAENIIASGKADGVALARPLFADPDFPVKAKGGREKEIVRCIPLCFECLEGYKTGLGATCYVWPDRVHERGYFGIGE